MFVSNNTASTSGGTFSSASSGAFQLTNGSVVNIHSTYTGVPAVEIREGGELNFGGNGSVLQCGAGAALEYNLTTYAQSFSDWVVDCTQITVDPFTHNASFTNPSCAQIRSPQNDIQLVQTFSCAGLPLHPPMLLSTGTASCRPCASSLYSLQRGKRQNGETSTVTCKACPFGMRCDAGTDRLRVAPDHWAYSLPTGEVMAIQCPALYCCSQNIHFDGSTCMWRGGISSDTACRGNRNSSVPLCGDCLANFSHTIDGVDCVSDTECGKIAGFVVTKLLYFFGFVLYALHQARHPALYKCLPACMKATAINSGKGSAVMFYYQLASYAVPRKSDRLVSQMARYLSKFCSMEHLSISLEGGTCVYKNMSATTKWVLQLFSPVLLIVVLRLVHTLFSWRYTRKRKPVKMHYIDRGTTESLLEVVENSDEEEEEEEKERLPKADRSDEEEGEGCGREELKASLVKAAACVLLLSFASLTLNTLQLLRCEHLETGEDVLYYAGGEPCSGILYWLMYSLLAFIVALPSWFVIVALLRRLPGSESCPTLARVQMWAHMLHLPRSSHTLRAAHFFACEPFKPAYWYWTPLLALQRCVTVMWMTFITQDSLASVGVSLITLSFLLAQIFAQPFKQESSNYLQTSCLICLTATAILSTVSSTLTNSGTSSQGTPLQPILVGLDAVMFVFMAMPLAILIMSLRYGASEGAVSESEGEKESKRSHSDKTMHFTLHAGIEEAHVTAK